MMLFYQGSINLLVSLICTSFRNDLFFCIFYILTFLLDIKLSRPIWAPHCPRRLSFGLCFEYSGVFLGLSASDLSVHFRLYGRSCTCFIFLLLFELFESFNRSYMCSCIKTVIVSIVISLFQLLFINSESPGDLPITDRNFGAINSTGVKFSNSQFFPTSSILVHTSSAVLMFFSCYPKEVCSTVEFVSFRYKMQPEQRI